MRPRSTTNSKASSGVFSLRTCVLVSVLLHLVLFYIPFHQSKVEAMSGSISMVVVSGAGKPGEGAAAPTGPAGPVKPKSVAEPKVAEQEPKAVPVAQPEPVVQPERKPTPVVQQKVVVPPKPKPKPVVRQRPVVKQPVVKVKATPPPPKVKPKKIVKKNKKVRSKQKKRRNVRRTKAKQVKQTKPVKTPASARKAPVAVAKAASVSPGGSRTAQQKKGTAGQGSKASKARATGGGGPKGPVHARFGSLHGPKVTRWMRPRYPRKARDMGQTGLVVLRITIDANGRPVRVEVAQRAGAGFDEAAVAAARRSSFRPATHKGRPVSCIALLPVRFNLKGN